MTVIATYTALLITSCAACGAILRKQPVEVIIRTLDDTRPAAHYRRPTSPASVQAATRQPTRVAPRLDLGDDGDALAARRRGFGALLE